VRLVYKSQKGEAVITGRDLCVHCGAGKPFAACPVKTVSHEYSAKETQTFELLRELSTRDVKLIVLHKGDPVGCRRTVRPAVAAQGPGRSAERALRRADAPLQGRGDPAGRRVRAGRLRLARCQGTSAGRRACWCRRAAWHPVRCAVRPMARPHPARETPGRLVARRRLPGRQLGKGSRDMAGGRSCPVRAEFSNAQNVPPGG
jgi:ferredoxin